MIDPSLLTSNYPNREALLSQAMSRQPQGAMQPPQPITTPPQQQPMVQSTASDTGLQSLIKNQETKDAQVKIQAALKEIVDTREKSGKKFLTPTQRLGIFTKHGLPSFAAKMINDAITDQQKELEPKYHTVTRPTPEGGKITGLETEEELRKSPIEEKPDWKTRELGKLQRRETTEKDYTDTQLALLGLKKDIPKTMKFEYYDKAGKKKVRLISEDRMNEFALQVEQAGGSLEKPEKEFATLNKDRLEWTEKVMKDWREHNLDFTPEQEKTQYDTFNAQYTGAIKGWTPLRNKKTGEFIFRNQEDRLVDERGNEIKQEITTPASQPGAEVTPKPKAVSKPRAVSEPKEVPTLTKEELSNILNKPKTYQTGFYKPESFAPGGTPSFKEQLQSWAGKTTPKGFSKFGEGSLETAIRQAGLGKNLAQVKDMADNLRRKYPEFTDDNLIKLIQKTNA